ncbi:MAG: hypothetical protein J6C40_01655 [Lentisphaeria bacterium]|nr:hypothetical protein [Lentisphaeria bacterium]
MIKMIKNSFIAVLAALFLNGCGPSEDNLAEQAEGIVQLKLLDNCYGFQQTNNTSNVFRFGKYHIVIITTGQLNILDLNLKIQDDLSLSGACLTRQYQAVSYKYEIQDVEIGKIVKSRKRVQSTIKAKIKTIQTIKNPVNGVELRFLLPPGKEYTDLAKKEIARQYSNSLPEEKFDFRMVQEAPGIPSEEINIVDIPVEWNNDEKCWVTREELSIKSPEDLNIPSPTWLDPAWNQDSLRNKLRPKGFEEVDGKFYRPDSLEIIKKMKAGLLFIGNSWVERDAYEDTKKLLDAKKKFDKDRTWSNYLELLTVLGTSEKAPKEEKEKIITFFHNSLQYDIGDFKKKEDRDGLKRLANNLKQSPGYKHLNDEMITKLFKEAEDHIANAEKNRAEAKQRVIAEKLKNAKDKADRCKKILADILKEMTPESAIKNPAAAVSALKELNNSFNETFGSSRNKYNELVVKYIAILNIMLPEPDTTLLYQFSELRHLARDCRHCKNGIMTCKECNGTKRCQRCNGNGYYYAPRFDGSHQRMPCNRVCGACTNPIKCRNCHGKGIYINAKRNRMQLQFIYKNMQKRVEQFSL